MKAYRQAWGAIRGVLPDNFRFGEIKAVAGCAGLDMPRMASIEYDRSGIQRVSKSQILSAIDGQVGEMEEQEIARFLRITTEEILRRKPALEPDLQESLERLGWTLHDRRLVEVAILDTSELPELPPAAQSDLLKAGARLRDGDLSGAVTSACASVDSVTSKIYETNSLGDPGKASFQEKVRKALGARSVLGEIECQLVELGWESNEAKMLAQNVGGSLNQAAFVLQTLRSKMGDVHGTKPVLKPLVFDSIKWAMLRVRLLA